MHFDDGIVVSARSVLPSGYAAYYTDDRLMQMLKAAESSLISRDALIDALNLTYPDGKSYYSIKNILGVNVILFQILVNPITVVIVRFMQVLCSVWLLQSIVTAFIMGLMKLI